MSIRRNKTSQKTDLNGKGKLPGRIVFMFLCFIPIFSIVAFGAVDTWQMSLISVFSGLLFLFWLFDFWKKNKIEISDNLIQLPLIGLILIGLIQLLPLRSSGKLTQIIQISQNIPLSFDPYTTRLAVIQLIFYLLFLSAALFYINSRKRVKLIIYILLTTAAVMAFIGIIQRIGNFEMIYGIRNVSQQIFFSSFVNQHHFASFMLMMIGLGLSLLFEQSIKKDRKIFLFFGFSLMVIGVIFTGSRGALLSLSLVIGFILAFKFFGREKNEETRSSKNLKIPIYIVSGLVVFVFLFGSILLLGGDQSLIRGIGLGETSGDVSNGRLHFWSVAWQSFLNHPIIGTGLDSFGVVFSEYDTWNGIFRVEQAHNDYLQILSDAGILGILCVISFFILLVKKGLENIKNAKSRFYKSISTGALAGCLGILIHSFVDFPLRTPANAFVFLICAVLATNLIELKKTD